MSVLSPQAFHLSTALKWIGLSLWSPQVLVVFFLMVCASLITIFICHEIFNKRTVRILREAECQWAARHPLENRSSMLIESIPSGWFNILLTSVWPSLLERFFSNLATERLEKSFEKRIQNQQNRFPWRHLSHISVEHVTLGLTPPQFQIALAKYDPTRQTLKLEADMKWTTSSFQIVLCALFRSPMLSNLKPRILLSNLEISGRISATLALSPDQPGIRSCELSFTEVPQIDMRVTPVGMALKDFPGIPESLRSTIVKSLTKGMVHPKSLTIDVRKIFDMQRMKRRGGKGGLMNMTLASAEGFFTDSFGSVEVFCECAFGKRLFRTPIRTGCHSVTWDWNYSIRLDEKIAAMSDQDLTIRLFSSKSLGEPTLLAEGTVSLKEIGASDFDSGVLTKSVSLQSKVQNHQPVVHLSFQLMEPTEQQPATPVSQSDDSPASIGSKHSVNSDASQEAIADQREIVPEETANMASALQPDEASLTEETGSGKSELIEATLARLREVQGPLGGVYDPGALSAQLSQTSSSSESGHCIPSPFGIMDSAPDIDPKTNEAPARTECSDLIREPSQRMTEENKDGAGFRNLLHVTKFDDVLRRDRLLYKQQLTEMQSQVVRLEQQLMREQSRRLTEGLRALTEGGRFLVHKQHERAVRHVWYDPTAGALNWSSQKLPQKDAASMQIKCQPLHQISEIRKGVAYFPKTAFFGLGALKSLVQRKINGQAKESSVPIESNSLSILFANNKALNLEIPRCGNGRSRDAWVEALQSLIGADTVTNTTTTTNAESAAAAADICKPVNVT